VSQVQSSGLGLIAPAGPGAALEQTPAYRGVLRRRDARQTAAARLRGGTPLAGQRLDSARHDAEAWARAAEWAEYLREVAPGLHKTYDRYVADGIALATSYRAPGKNSATAGYRMDATVPMASQGLTFILPEVYEYQHNDLPCWDEQFVKIFRGADPASNEVAWYEMDNIGLARASSSYDLTTIPMVGGPIASDNKILIVPALVGMETNFMDFRRQTMADRMGKPDFQIELMKREACNRTLAEFFDNLWFGGDAELGIDGLMNNPFVETVTISGAWSGKTALQIFDDLVTMAWVIYNRTGGALKDFNKIRIILPPDQFRRLSLPITSAGSKTILAYFNEYWQSNRGDTVGVPKVELQARLAAANSYAYNGGPNILSADTALILYEDGNPNVDPSLVLTQPIEVPAPVRQTGLGDVTYYHARGGGLKLPDARRIKYVVGL
jgi:hypothetical protein